MRNKPYEQIQKVGQALGGQRSGKKEPCRGKIWGGRNMTVKAPEKTSPLGETLKISYFLSRALGEG
jgi:hypothetical protein